MSGLQAYVKRATSPQANQSRAMPTKAQRAKAAQQAKVPLPKSNTKQSRDANGSMGPPPMPNLQANSYRGRNLNHVDIGDHEDSTKRSVVQVVDSQLDANGIPVRHQYDNQHPEPIEEGGDDGSEEYVDEEYETEEELSVSEEEGAPHEEETHDFQASTQDEEQAMGHYVEEHLGAFNTGDRSYPDTTSGLPSVGQPEEEEQAEVQPSGHAMKQRQPNYAPQRQNYQQQQLPNTIPQRGRPRLTLPSNAQFVQTQPQPGQAANHVYHDARAVARQPQYGQLPHHDAPPAYKPNAAPAQARPHSTVPKEATQQPFQQQGTYHGNQTTMQPTSYPAASTATMQPSYQPGAAAGTLDEANGEAPEDVYVTLDYDQDVLQRMNYNDLRNQSLDDDPRADQEAIKQLFSSNPETFPERMKLAQDFTEANQALFFSSLTLDQWEDGGDWFLSQFSELLGNMKKARRDKREMAARFEAEVHARNDEVEGRMKDIDRELKRIRAEGESVLHTPKKRKVREGTGSSAD